ncbi:ABC transporter substrate-binding protein [Vagococcus sp. JNUCC 83]
MKKKLGWLSLVSLLAVGVLSSCGTKEGTETGKQSDSTPRESMSLSVGVMPAVDSLPVYIAEKEGYFKEEGLDLKLNSFKSPKDRDAALTSGNLDGANTDLIALSTYRQGDLDVKIVSQSIGTFSVLTGNDNVTSLNDLNGKTVGYAKNQAPYYFLDEALKSKGLDVNDVGFEEVPQIPARVELTLNKKIDATVVPEPFRTIGISQGLRELTNSQDLDIQSTVFGFTNDALTNNKEAIEVFYRAYDKGVDYVNTHKIDDYYDVLKEKIGFTDEIKKDVTLPKYVHAKQIDGKQVDNAFNWSKEEGIFTKEYRQKDVMSDLLVK